MVRVPEHLRENDSFHSLQALSNMRDYLLRDHSVTTLPISRSLLVSLRLMWRSTLVSPLLMSTTCHRVSPPRATATELQGGGRGSHHKLSALHDVYNLGRVEYV